MSLATKPYSYRAYDGDGRVVDGVVEERSREAAIDALRRRGTFPVEIAESTSAAVASPARGPFGRRTAITRQGLVVITRELATLLSAQLPIDETLRIVALQPLVPDPARRILQDVLARVTAGDTLSDALARHADDFPEFYVRLVAASEKSGTLGPAMTGLAQYLERRAELSRRVSSALVYPLILLAAAIATLAIVTGVLVPAIAPVFEDAGASPPPVIAALRSLQLSVAGNWPLILAGFGALVLLGVRARQQPAVRAAIERTALRLPVAGRLIASSETARLSRTLSTLLTSGVPLLEALRVSGGALTTSAFRSAVEDTAETVSRGGLLSDGMTATGRFGELALRLTAIGERTAQLPDMLTRLARIEEEALQHDLDRLTGLIAPVMTVLIGLLVGGIILSVMGAIAGLNDLAFK
ncbi:MAG: type II secretion system F family protein [Hyphomicrobiaceae bacterium]|nr:type II secretion system F family protein [Hyphomicrobiaceae bacterium]